MKTNAVCIQGLLNASEAPDRVGTVVWFCNERTFLSARSKGQEASNYLQLFEQQIQRSNHNTQSHHQRQSPRNLHFRFAPFQSEMCVKLKRYMGSSISTFQTMMK